MAKLAIETVEENRLFQLVATPPTDSRTFLPLCFQPLTKLYGKVDWSTATVPSCFPSAKASRTEETTELTSSLLEALPLPMEQE
jgi:hypothetical protein